MMNNYDDIIICRSAAAIALMHPYLVHWYGFLERELSIEEYSKSKVLYVTAQSDLISSASTLYTVQCTDTDTVRSPWYESTVRVLYTMYSTLYTYCTVRYI